MPDTDTPAPSVYDVTSVWSAYGHAFLSTDGETIDDATGVVTATDHACLTCGALYTLRALADGTGEYVTASGGTPAECTGDTAMIHGYPGEREGVCDHHNGHTITVTVECPDDDAAGRGCSGGWSCPAWSEQHADAPDTPDASYDVESCEHCDHACPCVACDS